MSEMNQKQAGTTPVRFVQPEDGVFEIYANIVDVLWTRFDVRVRLAQVVPDPPDAPAGNSWVAEERAAVTFTWPAAKMMRDILTDLVARYEAANGEIKPPVLPDAP